MILLKKLCNIHAPSGNERKMTEFLIQYIEENRHHWKHQPELFCGEEFQECIVLIFGKPRTAVFAHIDNIGFTVRYQKQLLKVGSPHPAGGTQLHGEDSQGQVSCAVVIDKEEDLTYLADRDIDRGTDLSYIADWREDTEYIQCCYLDNRLGVWNALEQCKDLENGAIVFSCREEHGGGSIPFLSKFLYNRYKIRQALISDITWITEGVFHGKGVVISMRDIGIPRRIFLDRIIALSQKSKIPFQLEVEGSGGSDGTELQKQPYPIDWCFIGAAEEHVHTPDEKVHKQDIKAMVELYKYLLGEL